MALNITITSEIIKTALNQLTFREHDKQKIEIVDGVFAEVQMYNHTLFVDMTAKGWWARGMATLRFEYSMYTKDETPNLRDKSFNTSGGGIDGTEDFESYCAAMERRGLVHIAIAMIAEELNTPEFQEKITEAIKVDYALRLERREKARVKREEEEKQKQAEIAKKYNEWLETNTPLSEEGAKQEIKKVTQMNASKEDAEHFVTKQKIKVTSFCQNSGEVETQFFTVSHDYGRNTWTWEDNGRGEKPEGIAAKKVVQFMINSVVELVD